jgi:hypothetical protein
LLDKAKAYDALALAGDVDLYIDPEEPRVHRLLGGAYVETGKLEAGLTELDRALELGHPRPGEVQLLRARALLALGKRKDAELAAEAAVSADPKLKDKAAALMQPTAAAQPAPARRDHPPAGH